MSKTLLVRPDARAEFDEAINWIADHGPGTGEEFAEAIQSVFDRITANPKMHGIVQDDVRRAVVSGYRYYAVFYRETSDSIEVLSIFHTSQNPKLWQDRI